MAGSPANLHAMVPSVASIYDVLKVKVEVKGHVIRALLWCHEMFAIQYLLTFCLYMHSLYDAPLQSPSSISVRQLDVLSTSWNELLRHWQSGRSFRCVRSPLTWYINFSFVHLQYITSYVRPFWWSLVIVGDNYSSLVHISDFFCRGTIWEIRTDVIKCSVFLCFSFRTLCKHVGEWLDKVDGEDRSVLHAWFASLCYLLTLVPWLWNRLYGIVCNRCWCWKP